jgi:cytochrome c oxidase cbb3-type subunit 2
MSAVKDFASGWRGICLVAITYVYFLIFAQFAFLKRLGELGIADEHLKLVMAAMAAGGILFSLLAGRHAFGKHPRLQLECALFACATAALLASRQLDLAGAVTEAFLIGASLGLLTVTLVANLPIWLGGGDGLLKVGLGTGLGYLVCNFPPLFTAGPKAQAITAAAICLLGGFAASKTSIAPPAPSAVASRRPISFARVLLSFTALVWLDSAAFFIIQNTPALKAGTWEGTLHLWIDGLLHLAAAIASALLLRRKGLSSVLGGAILALTCACLLLLGSNLAPLASLFYPVGVSLYSVALVAYPSLLLSSSSAEDRARKAGLIYAVAGWFGSAMGIGMGQHLGHVPAAFVLLALLLVEGPQLLSLLRIHKRETGAIAATMFAAFCIDRGVGSSTNAAASSPIERGRHVYISEGCINCHSQYVRPGTADGVLWGPGGNLQELRSQRPPLIGNRRQGPDLSQVGGRRSPLWLKAHFYDPHQVSHASFMPSYSYLFSNSTRGDDLIAYLGSLKSPAYAKHVALEQAWQPSPESIPAATPEEGAHLFGAYCATCHEPSGATRIAWLKSFKRLPPNLETGPLPRLDATGSPRERELRLDQIIKFGIPETDMPGHEYLSDQAIASIALWLNRRTDQPNQVTSIHNHD